MSAACIAAGEIKDILSDTAHILLFGADQEDRNACFLVFLISYNCWGLLTSRQETVCRRLLTVEKKLASL